MHFEAPMAGVLVVHGRCGCIPTPTQHLAYHRINHGSLLAGNKFFHKGFGFCRCPMSRVFGVQRPNQNWDVQLMFGWVPFLSNLSYKDPPPTAAGWRVSLPVRCVSMWFNLLRTGGTMMVTSNRYAPSLHPVQRHNPVWSKMINNNKQQCLFVRDDSLSSTHICTLKHHLYLRCIDW